MMRAMALVTASTPGSLMTKNLHTCGILVTCHACWVMGALPLALVDSRWCR